MRYADTVNRAASACANTFYTFAPNAMPVCISNWLDEFPAHFYVFLTVVINESENK